MRDDGATTALAALVSADPDVMDRDGVGVLFGHARKLRGWLDAADVRLARRVKALAAAGESESAGSILTEEGGRSGQHAQGTEAREELCAAMPGFEDALASGGVTADHLDALNQATRNLTDAERAEFNLHQDELVDDALNDYVTGFGRTCKNLANEIRNKHRPTSDEELLEKQRAASKVSRWVDKDTGMHKSLLELDPLRDAKLWKMIDAEVARLKQVDGNSKTPFAQLQIEAFINVQTDNRTTDRGNRVPEISVLIDLTSLTDGRHAGSICETEDGTPIPVATVRGMACEADIIPVVLGTQGEVLDVGRAARTATRAQRRALAAMYRTCAHPHCTIGFSQCRIHHVKWWGKHHGRSDLNNLLPLCEQHHHLVHEGGWQLTLHNNPQRTLTWHRPDGTHWHTTPSPNRTPATRSGTRGQRAGSTTFQDGDSRAARHSSNRRNEVGADRTAPTRRRTISETQGPSVRQTGRIRSTTPPSTGPPVPEHHQPKLC